MTQVNPLIDGIAEYLTTLASQRLEADLEDCWDELSALIDPLTGQAELPTLAFAAYNFRSLPGQTGQTYPAVSVFITGYREHEDENGLHPDIYEYDLTVQIQDNAVLAQTNTQTPRERLHQKMLRHADAARLCLLRDPTLGGRVSISRLEDVRFLEVEDTTGSKVQNALLDWTILSQAHE